VEILVAKIVQKLRVVKYFRLEKGKLNNAGSILSGFLSNLETTKKGAGHRVIHPLHKFYKEFERNKLNFQNLLYENPLCVSAVIQKFGTNCPYSNIG